MKKKVAVAVCGGDAVLSLQSGAQIEALLTVDRQGQMVLPKGIRLRAGIEPGDKFALMPLDCGKEACCFLLVKSSALAGQVKNILNPRSGSKQSAVSR